MNIATDRPYKIFAEVIEQSALDQFESAMQQPFTVSGALMPDTHTGYALPIGAVVATDSVILPAWVGYDIGCGMCAMPTSFDPNEVRSQAASIFDAIYKILPVGFSHNKTQTAWNGLETLPHSEALKKIFTKKNGFRQLGSLGSGNHFVEIGIDETNKIWIIIHSGSRGVGHAVASHYMRIASGDGKAREGHYGFAVHSAEGSDYIKDLNFCLEFALENRREILRRIDKVLSDHCQGAGDWSALINRNHNHAEEKDSIWIHRKGATQAEKGMMGVIPGNMRDGSFIVQGKGNPDALWSSSHGAGRVLGRKQAKKTLKTENFIETMTGIIACVGKKTIDESPFAYKDIFDVLRQQSDLVEVIRHVKPLINIKG